eukprot:scaffold60076_cov16-Tisochrysis_lutea.AAC.1
MGTEIPARACSIKGQVRTQENKNCTREKQNNGQGPNKDKQGDGHFRLWRVSTDECRRQAWVHLNLKQQWRALLAEHDGRQAAHVIKRILGTKEASVGASEVEAAMTSLREGGGRQREGNCGHLKQLCCRGRQEGPSGCRSSGGRAGAEFSSARHGCLEQLTGSERLV